MVESKTSPFEQVQVILIGLKDILICSFAYGLLTRRIHVWYIYLYSNHYQYH